MRRRARVRTGLGTARCGSRSALLAAPARGRAAVEELGDDLDVAAARSGLSAGRLRELLDQRRARPGSTGPAGCSTSTATSAAASTPLPRREAAAFPYADSFLLHSRPNATRRVYLDFDGHQVSGTAWNDARHPVIDVRGLHRWTATPAFSDAELDVVQEVWARVAEDYAPFDIDVTTEDPGHRRAGPDLRRGHGVRHAGLGHHRPDMRDVLCGGGCAGVAYVGVVRHRDRAVRQYYQPAFALPKTTYTAAQVAEIVSHEVGHTLGLSHDGLSGVGVLPGRHRHQDLVADHGRRATRR